MKLRILLACSLCTLSLASHADNVVRLRCNDNLSGSPLAQTVDIDLANKTVFVVFDSKWPAQAVPAEIDDRFVTWRFQADTVIADRVDRVTGHLTWNNLNGSGWLSGGDCKKLDTKMF